MITSRRFIQRALLSTLVVSFISCKTDYQLQKTKISPDKVRDGEHVPRKGPKISDEPGMEALREYTLDCYNSGLKHDEIFARGGSVVIRWAADRNGDLLRVDFATNSFRGWEINERGESMEDCIVKKSKTSKVKWSKEGMAPMRISPQPKEERQGEK